MSNLRSGEYGNYYGSFFTESTALTTAQMKTNATYLYKALRWYGWSTEAISATLGNMQAESTINPGRGEGDKVGEGPGHGLVQWTHYTKYTGWCAENGLSDPSAMDSAILRIIYETNTGIQYYPTDAYPETFEEFTVSTKSPESLAAAFLLNYERPADQSDSVKEYRGSLARAWYTYLNGGATPPTPGGSTRKKRKKYNFILFGNKQWRNL